MLAIAHRGYSAAYPENTPLAFERAIESGADFIETDVRFTRDRALVCSHDPDLKRTAGNPRAVAELTLQELKGIRLAHGQSIPTLEEVLEIARGGVGVLLDVKVTTPEAVEAIAAALERTQMTEYVVYGARTLQHLDCVAQRCPGIALVRNRGREVWVTAGLRPRREAPGYATPMRARALAEAGVHALLVNDPTIVPR